MADKTINIKLTIDNKEAVASLILTDENVKALYDSFKFGKKEVDNLTTSISQGFNNAREIIQGFKETWSVLKTSLGAPVQEFFEYERVQEKLRHISRQATGATEEQVQALIKQAEALQSVGVVSKEAIVSAQAQFATFDLQTKSIEKLIPAFLDVVVAEKGVNASTDDMISYANAFGLALEGNYAALTQRGFKLDEETKRIIQHGSETEKIDAIVRVLNSTYDGLNVKMREGAEGGMKAFSFALEDIKKNMGDVLSTALAPMLEQSNVLIRNLNNISPAITTTIGLISTLGVVLVTLKTTGIDTVIKGLVFKQAALNAGIIVSMKSAAVNAGLTASNITLATSFRGATAAARTFFASLGPAGWLMIGIGSLLTLTSLLGDSNKELSETEIQLRVQKEKISDLTETVRDQNKSLDERKTALEEIQKLDPEFLKGIDLSIISTDELTRAINDNVAALEKRIQTKILEEELESAIRRKIEAEAKMVEGPSWFESILFGSLAPAYHIQSALDELNAADKEIKKIKDRIAAGSTDTGGKKSGGGMTDQEKKKLFDKQRNELAETQRHAETMLRLETDNGLIVLSEKIKHFDEMISLYRKFGEDTTRLVNQRVEAEAELQKKLNTSFDITIDDSQPDDEILKDILDLEEYKYSIKRKTHEDELNDWYRAEQERLSQYEYNLELQNALDEEYTARKEELKKRESETELLMAQQTIGMLAGIVNQNTAAGKAIAAANAIINTYEGATKALAQGGFWGILQMGVVIAAGLAQVNQILSTNIPKMPGFAMGGRLPKGQTGFVEGWHDEIIAPEKTFVEVFRQELRPQIFGQMSLGGNNNSELLKELKSLNSNMEMYAHSTKNFGDEEIDRLAQRVKVVTNRETY